MNRCIGCGITLQNTNPSDLGYTPKLENKYCERCFKTIHYNKESSITSLDNSKIIKKVNKLGYPVLFISDLFSLTSEVMKVFKEIKNPKILVINKKDLIPANLNIKHLKENMQKSFSCQDDIIFISVKNNDNLKAILNIIMENENLILMGETSSGKSSLLNKILNINLTTSKYHNTTLEFIKLKYKGHSIYDTPGILFKEKKENVEKIKVYTKSLSEEYVLKINDLKLKGKGNITLYIPNDIKLISKKEETTLTHEYLASKKDIELEEGGFITVSKDVQIYSNKDLEMRDSIISL